MMNTTRSINPLKYGLWGATIGGSLFILTTLLPRIMALFFEVGLNDVALWVVLGFLPIILIVSLSLFRKNIQTHRLEIIFSFLMSASLILFGLLLNFEFDENSFPSLVLCDVILLLAVILLEIEIIRVREFINLEGTNSIEFLQHPEILFGIASTWILGSILLFIFPQFSVLMYYFAGIFLLRPMMLIHSDVITQIPIPHTNSFSFQQSILFLINTLVIAFISVFFVFGISTYKINTFGWALLGFGIGIGIYYKFHSINEKFHLLINGAAMAFLLIQLKSNYEGLFEPIGQLFIGILMGYGILTLWAYLLKPSFHPIARYGEFFWTILLFLGGGVLANEVKYWIKYDQIKSSLLWGIISAIGIISIVLFIYQSNRFKNSESNNSSFITATDLTRISPISFHTKKMITISSLMMIFIFPIFATALYSNSNQSVKITFEKPMYTVQGEVVTSIDLKDRTAIILLNNRTVNNPNGTENIRPGKSIRLGGYYYSMGEFGFNASESAKWIGENNDVFSVGFAGSHFKPEDILTIRAMNPLVKFYYMAFATTLFEDSNSTLPPGVWGDSHYPTVKFNSTIDSWTLKYVNGTEALGVRREKMNDTAHLMDLGKLEWADYFAWIYTERAKQFYADGVAIDEVMWRGYWNTKIEQLRDYESLDEIIETCYKWLERLDNQTQMEVITQAFWDEAQVYQNGTWGEIAFRSGEHYGDRVDDRQQTVWYESMNWMEIVNDLKKQALQNKSYIWAAFYDMNSNEAREYALATYLMAKPNGCTSAVFHPHPFTLGKGYPEEIVGYSVDNVANEVANHSEYFDLELGNALGEMQYIESANGKYWQRTFENGIVIVNPYHAQIPGFRSSSSIFAPSH